MSDERNHALCFESALERNRVYSRLGFLNTSSHRPSAVSKKPNKQLQRRNAGNHKGCPYNLKRGAGPLPPGPNPSPPNPLSHRERGRKTKKTGLTQRHEGTEKSSQPRAVQTQIQTGILATKTHDRPEVELGVFPCHSVQHCGPGVQGGLVGHPIPICTTEAIHGKTGSAPSGLPAPSCARQAGALLFRPFPWAMQEKGQGNRGR